MSDFKEQVEEIVHRLGGISETCSLGKFEGCPDKNCPDCLVDRILSAHNARLDRIAEGIDKGRISTHERKQIVAYIQAQKEGM